MEEIAQIMYEAGCVHAVNLDGGGSSTYMSKPEGSDTIQVVNRPSDGYARSVAATLVAVSTAKSSKEFDRAIIESEYEYLTVGTSIKLNAIGVNNIGSSAVIPENAYWTVSDDTIGTIDANGEFTALANGDVTLNFIVNGEVAGKIDQEVKKIIDQCYEDARRIIKEHESVLEACAQLLLEKEKITKNTKKVQCLVKLVKNL
jgi:hypothetical protein